MLLKNISTGPRGVAIKGSILFADKGEVIEVEVDEASEADVLDAIEAGYFEEVKADAKRKKGAKADAEAEAAE